LLGEVSARFSWPDSSKCGRSSIVLERLGINLSSCK
jgi:hypothetical protein